MNATPLDQEMMSATLPMDSVNARPIMADDNVMNAKMASTIIPAAMLVIVTLRAQWRPFAMPTMDNVYAKRALAEPAVTSVCPSGSTTRIAKPATAPVWAQAQTFVMFKMANVLARPAMEGGCATLALLAIMDTLIAWGVGATLMDPKA